MVSSVIVLFAALAVAPSDRLAMADRLFNRGEYAAARAEYSALVGEKNLAADAIAFRRIYCDYQLGNKAAVRKDGEEFLKSYPASESAGDVRYFRAMSAEGVARINELRALDTDAVPASRRASVLCELGKLTNDADAFVRAQKVDPKGPMAGYAKYYHAVILSSSKDAAQRKTAICELLDVAFGADRSIGESALYSAACLSFTDQRYGEAVALAKQYLRKSPDSRQNIRQLRSIAAVSEYKSGKYSSAIEFCGDESGEEFDMIRALAYDRFGDAEKSLAAAKLYLERYPQGAHRKEVELLLARADFSAAEKGADSRKLVESARRAAELSDSAGDKLRYAWTLEKSGEAEKAEAAYEAVAAKYPKSAEAADAMYRRGLSLARRDQWSAAELSLAEALAMPALPADRRGLASYWRGVACIRLDHPVKAVAYLKDAIAARLPPDEEREAKLMLADIDYAAGRTDAAIAAYAELVRFGAAERMSAAKTYAVGLLLAPDEAKICADALTNSESAEWRQAGYALLGDVEEKRGNSAAAAVAWGKSLAEDATTQCKASASLKLGLYEAAKGALDAAERHLTLAIKLSSKDGEARSRAYLALAKCALARNNVEDARKYATVVVTLFEKTASAVEAGEILRKNVK